jgi:hypothetical protein
MFTFIVGVVVGGVIVAMVPSVYAWIKTKV